MSARGARAARGPLGASRASRILASLKGHVLFYRQYTFIYYAIYDLNDKSFCRSPTC